MSYLLLPIGLLSLAACAPSTAHSRTALPAFSPSAAPPMMAPTIMVPSVSEMDRKAGTTADVSNTSLVDVPAKSPVPKVARGTGSAQDKKLEEGDNAYAAGDFATAEKAYRAAGVLDPKDPAAIVGAIRARLAQAGIPTDFDGAPKDRTLLSAIGDLKKAIKLDASYGPAQLELGRALLVLGRAAEAIVALQRAVELSPGDAEGHSALGVAHLAMGKLDAALSALTKAAELAPGDAERQTNLGTALLAAGKTAEAIQVYRRAEKLAPQDARIQNDLGTALLVQNDVKAAIPHLEAAVALDPKRATYQSNLGYAHHLKGDIAKAMMFYREALQRDDRLASAWINLGNALAQSGHRKEAREAYEKAKAIDPTDPRVKAVIEELDAIERGGTP